MVVSNVYIAVAVSFSSTHYNVTEGDDSYAEVCLEVIVGTVNQVSFVVIETISESATGEPDLEVIKL